jgi:hypothetical protein
MQVTLKGVASTSVLQPLLKDEQRAKCGDVVDGPLATNTTINFYCIQR